MDRDKLIRLIEQYDGGLTDRLADFLIANGIGDITALSAASNARISELQQQLAKAEHDRDRYLKRIDAEKHRADVAEEALRKVLTQEEVNRIEEKTRTYLYDIKPIYTTIQKRMVNELEKAEERLREKQ